jgi:hypothetical protein
MRSWLIERRRWRFGRYAGELELVLRRAEVRSTTDGTGWDVPGKAVDMCLGALDERINLGYHKSGFLPRYQD